MAMFPIEIIQLIFETLSEQRGLETLGKCALASRQFRELAHDLLFRAIDIPTNDLGTRRALELTNIFLSNPGHAKRIRDVTLRLDPCPSAERDQAISSMLNFIVGGPESKVEVMALFLAPRRTTWSSKQRTKWTDIPEALRSAIEKILFSPALHTLTIHHGRPPLRHILSRLKNVKSLALADIFNPQDESEPHLHTEDVGAELDHPLRLRSLKLAPHWAAHLLSTRRMSGAPLIEWSEVKSLTFQLEYAGSQPDMLFSMMLNTFHHTTSLSALSFRGVAVTLKDSLFSTLHPEVYENLRLLNIGIILGSPDDDPYMGFLGALDKLPPNNSLQSISLEIEIHYSSDGWELDDQKWGVIQQVLVPSAFPLLKSVGIDIIVHDWDEDGEGECLVVDLNRLSFDSLRSYLSFSFHVKYDCEW